MRPVSRQEGEEGEDKAWAAAAGVCALCMLSMLCMLCVAPQSTPQGHSTSALQRAAMGSLRMEGLRD